MEKRYIGNAEDRINKWMRMCLQWQFDIRRGIEKKASHYFTKYHVGKYPKHFFDDIAFSVIDRSYVINKMNLISEARMIRDRKLGLKSNKVVLKQIESEIPDFNFCNFSFKRGKNTVVRYVTKSKYDLSDVSTQNLVEELNRRKNKH